MFLDHKKVLVFSAHAADFCSRAGGTIARFTDAGASVHIHDFTYGEIMESPALWGQQPPPPIDVIKAIRGEERERGAAILGATIDCFDYGDGPLLWGPERRREVMKAIRAFAPDVVVCHWIDDFLNPDHVEAAQAVLWATRYCGTLGIETGNAPCPSPEYVCYETQLGASPVTKFLPDFFVDIDSTIDRKIEAMKALASHPAIPTQYEVLARYRAFEAQLPAGMTPCTFAEGFCWYGKGAVR